MWYNTIMDNLNENKNLLNRESSRAILAGLELNDDISYYMEELANLAEAAGIEVLGELIQSRSKPDTATYIGSGKTEELAQLCADMEADMVIFNNELSGVQLRNLEEKTGVKVIDRTILILDIFADRAVSKEGKLQVELAQLQYRLPRLTGFGKALSRLGGGIGTRGPGEKKLETDRRHIKRKMEDIKRELEESRNNRSVKRSQREKAGIPMVALVGYTNSGKSALMNRFLNDAMKGEKTVDEKDMLFATLDTSHRAIKLDSNHDFILIDTVGFVSNLPHTLVKAFMATLEEAKYADLLLHVVDAFYEDNYFHIEVTEQVLKEIGAGDKEKIIVYNKSDLLPDEARSRYEGQDSICISARSGDNMDVLISMIKKRLFKDRILVSLLIPYHRGDVYSYLCDSYTISRNEYREEGIYVETELSAEDYNRLEKFRTATAEMK
ncbi:GTPase HflX [Bacillota bacterium]